MKKIFFLLAVPVTLFTLKSSAQDNHDQTQLSKLLDHYYGLKDALVAGHADSASSKAGEFIKIANSIDYKVISEGNINALLKDATPISESGDIKIQRNHFANLSANMITLARTIRFSSRPIYQAYCPMKKVNWLSSEKAIKNPYYGNAMLTCGEIVDTIRQ